MSSSYQLTTSLKIIRELQWVKEVIEGQTPSGALFTAIPAREFTPTITSTNVKLRKLGATDLTKNIEDTTDYDLSIAYAPIESVLLESMINVTGTNSRQNSYTFLISQQQNDGAGGLIEMYQIAKGAHIASVTINIESGQIIDIESQWLASIILDWSSSHNLISPTFASILNDVPWSTITTGPNPLTFNGNSYDIRNFSATINHNTDRLHILDPLRTVKVQPQVRDISLDIDIVYKDNTISQDVRTFTPRLMTMNLLGVGTSTNYYTLNFENVYLEAYNETVDATSTEAKVISYTGTATAVSLLTQLAPVIQTSIHKYDIVGTGVIQTSIQKYNLSTFVTIPSTQKYNILKAVLQTSIHKYNLLFNVLRTSIHKYNSAGTIIANSIQKYNMAGRIAVASIQKYNILKTIAQTSIQKYNLLKNVLQNSIHKYNLQSPKTFYLKYATSGASAITGTNISNHLYLASAATTQAISQTTCTDAAPIESKAWYGAEPSEPGTVLSILDWPNGNYTWRLNITSADANVQLTSITLYRLNSARTTIKASKVFTINQALGTVQVYSGTIAWSDGTQNPAGRATNDVFGIKYEWTKLTAGTKAVQYGLQDANAAFNTPL